MTDQPDRTGGDGRCSVCGRLRDAHVVGSQGACGRFIAPQKPAPDAMLEAMKVTDHDRDLAKNLLADLGDDGIEDSEIVAQWFRKVRVETLREYSAPVPSPDGAPPIDDDELAGWARSWHWNDCAEDKPADPSIYFRDMRMLKAFIAYCERVGLPSGAGAAEPDLGEIVHGKMRDMLAEAQPNHPALVAEPVYADGEAPWSKDEQFSEQAKACRSRRKQYGENHCGEKDGTCTECDYDAQKVLRKKYPVVAIPPVRGNREAIAHEIWPGIERLLVDECGLLLDEGMAQQRANCISAIANAVGFVDIDPSLMNAAIEFLRHGDGLYKIRVNGKMMDRTAVANALSLPVQPGAGEREAAIEECAKICERAAQRCVREQVVGDSVATFCAQQVRALSRQAPHSSREK